MPVLKSSVWRKVYWEREVKSGVQNEATSLFFAAIYLSTGWDLCVDSLLPRVNILARYAMQCYPY